MRLYEIVRAGWTPCADLCPLVEFDTAYFVGGIT